MECGKITPAAEVIRTYPRITDATIAHLHRGARPEFVMGGPVRVKICVKHDCAPAKDPLTWLVRVCTGL